MSRSGLAETAYVKDSLLITFRTGPSTQHTVVDRLSSGQPVEILGTDGDWSHVQLVEDGKATRDGWVLSQYLITRQPWKMQAETALKESAELRQRVAGLEKELSETVRRGQELAVSLEDTAATLAELREEHESLKEGAASFLELKATHEATQSELETTQLKLEELSKRYEKLRGSETWKWFGTGGGVVLLAVVFGIVLGRKQKKRRSSYY
ncbi:MAG: TIGR04211 family SH3 domain-containing protein [Deltaproteobacteria bacterium]|nr:TIGR04211 family SH3 domain-containing protein [Deltaproteobacteria bacterium]